jgi:4-hydroxy-2-oxoheptanedioate aldolase
VACGIIAPWPDPHVIEIAGTFGFDFALIDAEHGALDVRTCADLVRAAEGVGISPIVRVAYGDNRGAYTHLDAGAHGLMFPHIASADAARAAASACLFGPEGTRAAIPSSRAARYGSLYPADEYYARANESVWIMPLIEEVEGVRDLKEILSVPRIRAFFIGPADLALSAGRKSVSALIDEAIATGLRLNKIVGVFAGTAAEAAAYVDKGVRMTLVGASGLLTGACKNYIAEVRDRAVRRE